MSRTVVFVGSAIIDGVLERLTGSPTAREHAPREHAPGERQAS
jgi:hypothetical protein